MTSLFHTLAQYKSWSDNIVFETLNQHAAIFLHSSEQQAIFERVMRVVNHIYIVDRIWQSHILNQAHQITDRNPKEFPPLAQLQSLQQAMDQWYINWSQSLNSDQANKKSKYQLINGTEVVMTQAEALLHVVNHTSFHRGFVATLLKEIDVKLPATDLNIYLQNNSLA